MSLIKISLVVALCLISTQAARIDIVNQCGYTVWPAAIPVGGGRRLNQGETWPLDIPAGTQSARIWGRTGCSFDNSGRGGCQSADCGGDLSCHLSGKPPATLFEFSLNGYANLDYINLSVVDGFNIPMQFSATSNGCNLVKTCGGPNCPDAYTYPTDPKQHECPGGTNYRVVFCP